jgi:hypothetical protein
MKTVFTALVSIFLASEGFAKTIKVVGCREPIAHFEPLLEFSDEIFPEKIKGQKLICLDYVGGMHRNVAYVLGADSGAGSAYVIKVGFGDKGGTTKVLLKLPKMMMVDECGLPAVTGRLLYSYDPSISLHGVAVLQSFRERLYTLKAAGDVFDADPRLEAEGNTSCPVMDVFYSTSRDSWDRLIVSPFDRKMFSVTYVSEASGLNSKINMFKY